MRFLFNLIKSLILAPFKLVKFILADVVLYGLIGGVVSLIKSVLRTIFRLIFRPFTMLLVAGCAAAFYFASEEQKKKVKALLGME
ncbi:MAG TPA: hypothetical protein VMU10_01485 [Desulfomonilia bacterium]|nr:hypothetical protein [Desulfomonilia bacterium]